MHSGFNFYNNKPNYNIIENHDDIEIDGLTNQWTTTESFEFFTSNDYNNFVIS